MPFFTFTQAFPDNYGPDRESLTINSDDIKEIVDVEAGGVGRTEMIMKDSRRHNAHESREEIIRMINGR